MAIKTIEYDINVAGITPATEQFGGTQGDHNVTSLNIGVADELLNGIEESVGLDKAMYRFDVYDGQGGVWQSAPQLLQQNLTLMLEERHTRYGGKITVYLVITVLSEDGVTEMELYSFPMMLRLKNRPEGMYQDGENYESVTSLAEMAKSNALAAEETKKELQKIAATVEEKLANGEFDGKDGVSVTHSFDGTVLKMTSASGSTEVDLKGDKGPQGEKGDKGDAGKDALTDQTYNAESENAQSGKAVAEAIDNTAVLKTQLAFTAQARKVPQYNDGRRIQTDTPVNSQDCVNKQYIDNNYYTKDEVDNLDAIQHIKVYDKSLNITNPNDTANIFLLDDGTINVDDGRIVGMASPVNAGDAATKGYVDDAVANAGGADWELIEDITLTEDVLQINIQLPTLPKEIYVEMVIHKPTDYNGGRLGIFFQYVNEKSGGYRGVLADSNNFDAEFGIISFQGTMRITPSGRITTTGQACSGEFGYTKSNINSCMEKNSSLTGTLSAFKLQTSPEKMGVGSTIKVWGR